jgi:apolipoprotein N-acyltransferase
VGHDPQTAIDTAFGRLSGALCYDYDYPAIAAEHGRLGADIVALPSSDWRGIDPIHTEMATMRAIEQGVSIVRSTRFGLSAGIDPHGVMRARRSSFETQGRILWIDIPQRGTPTVYRRIGDVFVAAYMTLVVACLLFTVRRNLDSSRDLVIGERIKNGDATFGPAAARSASTRSQIPTSRTPTERALGCPEMDSRLRDPDHQ